MTDTTTIDLASTIYVNFVDDPDKATPREVVLETISDTTDGLWYDVDTAVKDLINHVQKIVKPADAIVSEDGMTATEPRVSDVSVLDLLDRADEINIKAICDLAEDDKWVVSPYGQVYSSDVWPSLYGLMDRDIAESLESTMCPCTCQAFADAYALAHEEKYDEEWEPYTQHPQI